VCRLNDDEVAASVATYSSPAKTDAVVAAVSGSSSAAASDSKSADSKSAPASSAAAPARNPHADPTGVRNGRPPEAVYSQILTQTAAEAEAAASNSHAVLKRPITLVSLRAAVTSVKAAVIKAYPASFPEGPTATSAAAAVESSAALPPWDPVKSILDGKEDLTGHDSSKWLLDESSACLWGPGGKLWPRDSPVGPLVSRNDKVTVIVKLTKKGAGAPAREPAIDEAAQKAIYAMHRKREDERLVSRQAGMNPVGWWVLQCSAVQWRDSSVRPLCVSWLACAQATEADTDISHHDSAWANNKAFHLNAQGIGQSVKWKPF
jgi:hypothetical protein